MKNTYWRRGLVAGLIVGTFDITAAMTQFWIKTGKDPRLILKYVASGALGKAATEGGAGMMLAGLLFHYAIALSFALFFFWLYRRWRVMQYHPVLTGIGYGFFMSVIMQGIVVPLSNTTKSPYHLLNSAIAAVILIVCIGVPLSFFARRANRLSHVPDGYQGKVAHEV